MVKYPVKHEVTYPVKHEAGHHTSGPRARQRAIEHIMDPPRNII